MGVLVRRIARAVIAALAVLWSVHSAAATTIAPIERVVRNVVVRDQPATRSVAVGALRPGDVAELLSDEPGWYRIRLPAGIVGYVSKQWATPSAAPVAAAGASFKLHMIDVGTGLALFVEGPGFTLLYDAGSQDDLAMGSGNRVVAYIKAVRPDLAVIDHLILSHPHKDHLELMPDVFDRFVVRNVWDSGTVNPTRGYCRFLKKVAAEPGVQYHDAIATGGVHEVEFSSSDCSGRVRVAQGAMMSSQPVRLGPAASMSILYRDASRHADPNENTVVVRLDLGMRRVLIAGDAEGGDRQSVATPPSPRSIEGVLLACCRADLRADVLVVGHHGSVTSSRQPFLDAVGATIFLVSSGPHPYQSVRLPDAAVMAELSRRGQVWRTDVADERCGSASAKVGGDADESPGGCDNVLVSINAANQLASTYHQPPD